MKKAVLLVLSLGLTLSISGGSIAFAGTVVDQKTVYENSLVAPEGGDYVTTTLSTSQPYFNQLYLDGTGSWDGGNGFFGSTIYWGDGNSSGYSGYNKTKTWRWLYGSANIYRIQLNTNSGGVSSWDWRDIYVKNW
ncbi:hypothetical protein CIG75_15955 [Tumebacillus algifaecis]|uniref:PLAT domain-containing protein n=1 Tax=Tumebacillus algifaecis TaxID=1214604 RepID=A0A223D3X9_9BACL|nr:hypothetical protein [Tumebacillus algifaecis]ASS76291.1 hypothetical protein CIG75_15955 [Tumebacillus algifaecis]